MSSSIWPRTGEAEAATDGDGVAGSSWIEQAYAGVVEPMKMRPPKTIAATIPPTMRICERCRSMNERSGTTALARRPARAAPVAA